MDVGEIEFHVTASCKLVEIAFIALAFVEVETLALPSEVFTHFL